MNLSLKPLKMYSVGDIFPSQTIFSDKSVLPWGMPCGKKLLTPPQSVSIVSILLHVHLFCEPIIFLIH